MRPPVSHPAQAIARPNPLRRRDLGLQRGRRSEVFRLLQPVWEASDTFTLVRNGSLDSGKNCEVSINYVFGTLIAPQIGGRRGE